MTFFSIISVKKYFLTSIPVGIDFYSICVKIKVVYKFPHSRGGNRILYIRLLFVLIPRMESEQNIFLKNEKKGG